MHLKYMDTFLSKNTLCGKYCKGEKRLQVNEAIYYQKLKFVIHEESMCQ